MKALIVIFMLCGQPFYIVGGDETGPLVGPISQAPQKAIERVSSLLRDPTTMVLKRDIAVLSGGQCV